MPNIIVVTQPHRGGQHGVLQHPYRSATAQPTQAGRIEIEVAPEEPQDDAHGQQNTKNEYKRALVHELRQIEPRRGFKAKP